MFGFFGWYVCQSRRIGALKVFDESPERNKCESILLWNVLINGCCKVGHLGEAVELFEGMPWFKAFWGDVKAVEISSQTLCYCLDCMYQYLISSKSIFNIFYIQSSVLTFVELLRQTFSEFDFFSLSYIVFKILKSMSQENSSS